MLKKLKEIVNRNFKSNGIGVELKVEGLKDKERKILQREFRTAIRRIQYGRRKKGINPLPYQYRIKG